MATTDVALAQSAAVGTPEFDREVDELYRSIVLDPRNPQAVSNVGLDAQKSATALSDSFLGKVKVQDSGEAGKLLSEVAIKCKAVNLDSGTPSWRSNLSKLPGIGGLFNSVQHRVEGSHSVLDELADLVKRLETAKNMMLRDIQDMDTMYDQNLEIYRKIRVIQAALTKKRNEMDATTIPEMKAKAEQSNDTLQGQMLADLMEVRNRLDKRIHDLELTAMVRMQFAPSIRMVQAGNRQLAEKLQSSILTTIPLWKDGIAMALFQERQKGALESQTAVDDATNALLLANAQRLHQNSVQVAHAANRAVVDVETLKSAQENILAAIKETQAIAVEGAQKRVTARQELVKMEEEMKAGLLSYGVAPRSR